MWPETEIVSVWGADDRTFPALINPQVTGIDLDVFTEQYPSPVALSEAVVVRGDTWLVVTVREWALTGSQLAVSKCNQAGILRRREPARTPYGTTYTTLAEIPWVGVWRTMSTTETPEGVVTNANLMPVGGWDWQGKFEDLLILPDGTQWEQRGVTMSDRTALSMVLSGTAVVQLRQVHPMPGDTP